MNVFTTILLRLLCWTVWKVDDVVTSHFGCHLNTLRQSDHHLAARLCRLSSWAKHELFGLYQDNHGLYPKGTKLTSSDVPSIHASQFKYQRYRDATQGFRTPLVIPQLFADSDAVLSWQNKQYLLDVMGNHETKFLLHDANNFTFDDDHGLMRANRTTNTPPPPPTYSQILETMAHDRNSRLYVSGDVDILSKQEQMHTDLNLERVLGRAFVRSPDFARDKLYFFVGNNNTGTAWHSAPHRSLFVMIAGAKRWQFIDPQYSIHMRPERSHIFKRLLFAENKEIHSNHYDFLPRFEVVLQPGDALFVPPYWWHEVSNVETNDENLNIGVDIDTEQSNWDGLCWMFPCQRRSRAGLSPQHD